MIAVIALFLLFQDPPPGEVVATAPPTVPAAALADPFAAVPPRATTIEFDPGIDVDPEDQPRRYGTLTATADGELARRSGGSSTARPLPAAAYEDPIRYAADACRTGTRPEGEDMASCYSRIETTVAAARRPEPPRRPRVEAPPRMVCENSQSRDADGRTSSTSGRCTVGTGDPALLDDILDFD